MTLDAIFFTRRGSRTSCAEAEAVRRQFHESSPERIRGFGKNWDSLAGPVALSRRPLGTGIGSKFIEAFLKDFGSLVYHLQQVCIDILFERTPAD